MTLPERQPIGVFDSGLGGLSTLLALRRVLPHDSFVYLGDTAHVPYGPRPTAEVRDFAAAISHYLLTRHRCRAIVVACNTASGAGLEELRPFLLVPLILTEPGVKPAVAATRTGKIAVLATSGTLTTPRFGSLIERYANSVQVITQPCPGWVQCVEDGAIGTPEAHTLIATAINPLLAEGVDTLVLGCTHFPFLIEHIRDIVGNSVTIIDTGNAVAQQVERVAGKSKPDPAHPPTLLCLTTGKLPTFTTRAQQLLQDEEIPVTFAGVHWKQGELSDDATS